MLEIVQQDALALNALYEHLVEQIDEEANDIEQDLIRLGHVLLKRSIYDGQITTLITNLMEETNQRDSLLKMGLLSPTFSLTSSFISQETFRDMIPFMTNDVIESLNDCLMRKNTLESLTTLNWPESLSYLTYMSDRIDIKYE